MKNKTKITVAIFLFLSCFLININGVNASVYDTAEALVDKVCAEKGGVDKAPDYCRKPEEQFLGPAQEYDYIAPINNLNPDSHIGTENLQIVAYNSIYSDEIYRASYMKYFVMSYAINGVDPDDGFLMRFGYAFDPKFRIIEDRTHTMTNALSLTNDTKTAEDYDSQTANSMLNVFSSAPEFVKINLSTQIVTESNESEYLEYTSNMIKKLNLNNNTFRLKDKKGNKLKYNSFGDSSFSVDSNLVIWPDKNNIESNSEVVLMSTNRKQKYNSEYFDKLVSAMIKYADSEEKFVKAYLNLSQIIDTGAYDNKTFSDLYYKATKNQMNAFMAKYLKDGITSSAVETVSKSEFSNWFDLTGRYILEDGEIGVKRFKDYFNFIFADMSSYDNETKEYKYARTANSDIAITLDQESYVIILNSINDMIKVKDTFDAMDRFNADNCSLFCTPCLKENGTACTECQKSNASYKSCTKCNSTAKEECKNVPSAGESYCYTGKFDTCLDKELGDGAANSYHNAVLRVQKEFDDSLNNTIDDLIKNLEKLDLYEFNDIIWKQSSFNVKCEDYEILRYVWLIITIGAPFIVIILGSIDFFKNVVYSRSSMELVINPRAYETEWTKNKRRFVRRIIALIVLIVTPILIKIIITGMTPEGSGARNIKMMQCIVNGK